MAVRLTKYHFELLGITREATQKEIKTAYRLQMSLWHPDKFHNDGPRRVLAEERSKGINEAYELLKFYVPYNCISTKAADKERYQRTERKPRTTSPNGAEKVFVNSTNILSICYMYELKVLIVDFVNGRTCEYYDVPM